MRSDSRKFDEPADAEGVARALADAARERRSLVVRGGGTKSDWAPAPPDAGVLSTARLNRVVAHRHGDLTATVEAGARLADVNRELRAHGQWLALDPAWSGRATIGGIVATSDAGPRRHRFGSPRDQIIGIEIARADGERAKAGGIVVKNVAGYDLARLMTGSFGCLGVILNATFKLYPLTASSRTLVCDLPSNAEAGHLIAAINASQLTPTALEIQSPPLRALIRFESTDASTATQSAAAARLAEASGARTRILAGDEEQREWAEHADRPWKGAGAVAKVTLLPSDLALTLDALMAGAGNGTACEVAGRAGLGVLLARFEGDVPSQARAIARVRGRTAPHRGSVVVLRGSSDLRASVDPWGPMGSAFPVMQSVKRAFDPLGILNPGLGPGGL